MGVGSATVLGVGTATALDVGAATELDVGSVVAVPWEGIGRGAGRQYASPVPFVVDGHPPPRRAPERIMLDVSTVCNAEITRRPYPYTDYIY